MNRSKPMGTCSDCHEYKQLSMYDRTQRKVWCYDCSLKELEKPKIEVACFA